MPFLSVGHVLCIKDYSAANNALSYIMLRVTVLRARAAMNRPTVGRALHHDIADPIRSGCTGLESIANILQITRTNAQAVVEITEFLVSDRGAGNCNHFYIQRWAADLEDGSQELWILIV
jgi:hypothetical protein